MNEERFAKLVGDELAEIIGSKYEVRQGAPLYYEVPISNRLEIEIDPTKPIRGQYAFQTDLCIFERMEAELLIPRVVLEFKLRLTTHDVLTYSTKARRHKQVYPYLRYGLIIRDVPTIPPRFFRHNDGLDFAIALNGCSVARSCDHIRELVKLELEASDCLDRMTSRQSAARTFRLIPSLTRQRGVVKSGTVRRQRGGNGTC